MERVEKQSLCERLQGGYGRGLLVGLALLFVLLAALTLDRPASAAQTVPYKINFQGRLNDATGAAKADGQYNMTFRLYGDASGGSAVWTEVREQSNRVTVTNGQFNVQLGDVAALSTTLFTDQSIYLEVELPTPATATCGTASCGSYTEGPMTPRQVFASGAFAMNADQIDGIDGANIATLNGSNTFSSANHFNDEVNFNEVVFFNGTTGFSGSTQMGGDDTSKLWITNTFGDTLFNADTTNMLVKVGTDSSASLANVRLLTTSAEFSGTVRIGTATNGVDISGPSGILLSGTARRPQSISLMPEYANSVLDAGSGGNNLGSMTSKFDLGVRRNYYKWTTTQATAQSYDVVVQVPIPSDFSAWASTTPITVETYTSDTTNGTVTIQARDTTGATVSGMDFSSITPTLTTVWQSRSPGTISGTYTPGDSMLFRIRMTSQTGVDVRIGKIKMDYLSRW